MPGGPPAPRGSLFGAALGSAVVGAASGGSVLCLALFAYAPNRGAPGANFVPVLVAGVGGLAAGAIVAWALSRAIENPWRRATLAMMGVMGTAVIGAFTMPAHASLGPWGLLGLFAICLCIIAVAWRFLLSRPGHP